MTLETLGMDGKWILYGLLTGGSIEKFNLAPLLAKRIHLINSTLRYIKSLKLHKITL